MNNECHLFKKGDNIDGWVVVDFNDLHEFAEIIGSNRLSDGGIKVTLVYGYLAVEIEELIEGCGETLLDYKDCFDSDEWEEYFG
jgi:hypothetical protein